MELIDINEVCNMLGTTSRTLRYYEEKGIVKSTVMPLQQRRKYSLEQVDHIKKVLVLRTLGLSISHIQQLQRGNIDLSAAITQHKAQLTAAVVAKAKEIRLLDEALSTIETGGDIFKKKESTSIPQSRMTEIANIFTDAFLSADVDLCFSYFTDMLKEYLPLSAFKRVINDTLQPLGGFVSKGKLEYNDSVRNAICCDLQYENLGLYLTLVFHKEKVHGIWFNYHE